MNKILEVSPMFQKQRIFLFVFGILSLLSETLWAQYAGGSGTVDNPFLIATAEQLNTIGLHKEHWTKHFKQIADIDLGIYPGEQFNKIGLDLGDNPGGPTFTGTFDGNGFKIRNFTYSSARKRIGMFEAVGQSGELHNITMIDPKVECPNSTSVAALCSSMGNALISNCKVLGGTIVGDWCAGGIVAQCWAGGSGSENTKIINCHVTCNITADRDVGGIIGSNFGRVHNCSAAGVVSGRRNVGGLVGSNSYSAPWNTIKGEIKNSYSTCQVSGAQQVGGLVGMTGGGTIIVNSYAVGQVTGNNAVGGLVGNNSGASVSGCFWDCETSGLFVSAGGTGLTTAQMQDVATYLDAGWDLEDVWMMKGEGDYPKLKWESVTGSPKKPIVVQAEDAVIQGGIVEYQASGFKGTGYVHLLSGTVNKVEWTLPVFSPGTRTLRLRYANGANHDASVQVTVNGVVIQTQQDFPGTGAWDNWNSVGICTYLNYGNNVIALATMSPFNGLYLDELGIIDSSMDLAYDSALNFSGQNPDYPAIHAIDANCTTCWIADGYPQWIEMDLGLAYAIYRTELRCVEDRAYQFTVEAKLTHDDPYVLIVDRSDNETAGGLDFPITDAFEPMLARFVRLTITDAYDYSEGDVGISEFTVFGLPPTPAISIGSRGYETIQTAVDTAESGDVIMIRPGLYRTNLQIIDKALTLTSIDPDDPAVTRATVIEGMSDQPVISIDSTQDETSLVGLTLTGGRYGLVCNEAPVNLHNCQITGNYGHGIQLTGCPATIDHCLLTANQGAGILMERIAKRNAKFGTAEVVNCTLAQNAVSATINGQLTAINSIFWLNGDGVSPQIQTDHVDISYCTMDVDPCFVRLGDWADLDDPNSEWLIGDYHLRSESPCIDAGDPDSPVDDEPEPNGGRINLGAYGGTIEASLSSQ